MLSDNKSSISNISSTGALTLTEVDTPPSAAAAKSRLNLMLCLALFLNRRAHFGLVHPYVTVAIKNPIFKYLKYTRPLH